MLVIPANAASSIAAPDEVASDGQHHARGAKFNWHIAIEPCNTQGLTKLGGQFACDFEHPVNKAGPAGTAAANNQRHTGSGACRKKLPPSRQTERLAFEVPVPR